MFRIKRLHTFIIQAFTPYFAMTLGICLFILLMQFLWKQIENFVGKGIELPIMGELFFYAALSFVPMALPLAILLASLMTFGGLGERLELLAIKASGVSLLMAMKSLIILMIIVSIGSFFFQNEVTPRINLKFSTLLYSIKQKTPELDIPEGAFYSGIDKYSIYVKKKDKETRMLHDVMIYDASNGFNKLSVIVCDSAKLRTAEDKTFLLLTLYEGQNFSTMSKKNDRYINPFTKNDQYILRESFKKKEMIRLFDTNFNRKDESIYQGVQISKNYSQLSHDIDSMRTDLDSLNKIDRKIIYDNYFSFRNDQNYRENYETNIVTPTDNQQEVKKTSPDNKPQYNSERISLDSTMSTFREADKMRIFENATSIAENNINTVFFKTMPKTSLQKNIRLHEVERSRKFALAFACIVFFLIGAPLGAIIRKGGIGMPVVISVIFFIIYYIFDNIGVKMSRDGVWPIWQGVWLSTIVLFPVGIFLTYKAVNDSALFNTEAYGNFIRKMLYIRPRIIDENETHVNIEKIKKLSEYENEQQLIADLSVLDNNMLKDVIKNYQQYKYSPIVQPIGLSILKSRGDNLTDIRLRKHQTEEAQHNLREFVKNIQFAILSLISGLLALIAPTFVFAALAGYVIFLLRAWINYLDFNYTINHRQKIGKLIIKALLLYTLCIVFGPYLNKEMKKNLNNIEHY